MTAPDPYAFCSPEERRALGLPPLVDLRPPASNSLEDIEAANDALAAERRTTRRGYVGGDHTNTAYSPHFTGWRTITPDYYDRMREHYRSGRKSDAQVAAEMGARFSSRATKVNVGDITYSARGERIFALGPGPVLKAICQTSSC